MPQKIERLAFESLSSELQTRLQAKYDRLGYLGEFFQVTGNQPDILAPFIDLTDGLKNALPDKMTELTALTIASLANNTYELHQHQRLSQKLGFGKDWIATVGALDPENAAEFTNDERIVQRFVIAAVKSMGRGIQEHFDAVQEVLGPQQAIALIFLTGRYVTHAIVVNALALAAPVPSIFDSEETA